MEFEKVRAVVAEQMNIQEDKIKIDTSFADDLSADSLDLFQIVSELEEVFDIEFAIEDAENIKTVADAVNYIKERV